MSSYFNVARKYRKKPDLTPVLYESQDFFSVPRRYNFAIPPVQTTELPNKCRHLNDIIKKLILAYLGDLSIIPFRVEGNTVYMVPGVKVQGSTLKLNSRATILSNTLALDYVEPYSVSDNTVYTTSKDSVDEETWAVSNGRVLLNTLFAGCADSYIVLDNTLYATDKDNISNETLSVGRGTVEGNKLIL